MSSKYLAAHHGISEQDYKKIGISSTIVRSEDGMRTNGAEGSYEWWYTDAEFADGTTVVAIFYSKSLMQVAGPASPKAELNITYPNGEKISRVWRQGEGQVITASTEKCDVRIGECYFVDEGDFFTVHYQDEKITYHAKMTSTLPPWRPDTGEIFFGDSDEHFFAWFVAQPASQIDAELTVDGVSTSLCGTGYHDHNWGNIRLDKLVNHWYWGRAKVGEYNIIACDIIGGSKYGYKRFPIMFIAKDGKIITGDQNLTKIERADTIQHPVTGKFMDNILTYTQPISPDEQYTIVFERKRDIVANSLLGGMNPLLIKILKAFGTNPTYSRVLGDVTITHQKGVEKTVTKQEGLWEQMFFGGNKTATIGE